MKNEDDSDNWAELNRKVLKELELFPKKRHSPRTDEASNSTRYTKRSTPLPSYSAESTTMTVLKRWEDTGHTGRLVTLVDSLRFGEIRLFPLSSQDMNSIPELNHQNIVSHYGLLEAADAKTSLMVEYLEDGTLLTNLENRTDVTEDDLALWMLDIARGLYFLHSNEIAYGGLDMDTIFINGSRAKIEHPLLIKTKAPQQNLSDFANTIEKALALLRNANRGQPKRYYLTYLVNVIRKADARRDIVPSHTKRTSAATKLSQIITLLEKHIPGESISPTTRLKMMYAEDQTVREEQVTSPTEPEGPIPTLADKDIGVHRVIQIADSKSGQGCLLEIDSGRFGQALFKILESIDDPSRLMELYSGMGLSDKVLVSYRWAEEIRNRAREIEFVSRLNHPNITKILAFISPSRKAEHINAIIMEGAPLGTLENYAKKNNRQLPDSVIKDYARQLANALRYCHEEKHLIHRDVRPRNIYVHENGETIKLGNFGYAREENGEVKAANKGDELCYKAPEIISNKSLIFYSYSVDVYSYALVLWSICHQGRKPFWDHDIRIFGNHFTFREYLEASNGNRPSIRGDLDPTVADVIQRCWINLGNRRPNMAEIAVKFR